MKIALWEGAASGVLFVMGGMVLTGKPFAGVGIMLIAMGWKLFNK